MESSYVSIKQKRFVDRGFLIGPYCPIYGWGSLAIILYLNQYKDNFVTVFILGVVICAFIEYITSYIMEKIFKARWWDYSDKKFNLNGRVCGENAILFGLGGLLIIYMIQPVIEGYISKLSMFWLSLLSILFFIIFLVDTIVSFNIVNKLKENLGNIEIKRDSTQEMKNLVTDILNSNFHGEKIKKNILQRRIIKAFPNFDINKFVVVKNSRVKNIKELFNHKK